MNKKQIMISLGLICFLLVFCIILQIRTIKSNKTASDSTFAENGLRDEVLRWKAKYDETYAELEKTEKTLEEKRKKATENDSSLADQEKILKTNNTITGLTDVSGKGVIVTVQDNQGVTKDSISSTDDISLYVVHNEDLLSIVNELKNAGAEAISINNERVISTTAIECAGNVAEVNGNKIGSPFEIKAIGIPEYLYGALTRPGGYIELLNSTGVVADVKKSNNILIPKYSGVLNFKYVKNVK